MQSKKELLKNLLLENSSLLQCPICKNNLEIKKDSLVCCNAHNFDIAKNGLLLLHKKYKKVNDTIYTKELFENRRRFIKKGFYDDIQIYIKNLLNKYFGLQKIKILDLGSGECSYLVNLKQNNHTLIGIDLSYDAIKLATDYLQENILPLCADLYNLPFMNNSFDCIIDILSPFNKNEVDRVLKENGLIIKVVPCKNYLVELRNALGYEQYEKEEEIYSNIIKNFQVIEEKQFTQTKQINQETLIELFKMTPLSNHKICNLENLDLKQITIDLKVFVLKKS